MATALKNMMGFRSVLDKYEIPYNSTSFGQELAINVKAPMQSVRDFDVLVIFREDGKAVDFITSSLPRFGTSMLGGMSCCNSLNSNRVFPTFYLDNAGALCAKAVCFVPEEGDDLQLFGAFVNFFNDIDMNYGFIQFSAQQQG